MTPAASYADVDLWRPDTDSRLTAFGSLLTRLEGWSWFEAGADAENDYLDGFETVRIGLNYQHPHLGLVAEGQYTQFQNLPGDAVASAPRGALGTTSSLTVYGYCGHIFGGSVVEAIYAGTSANFAHVEAEMRF